MNELMYRNRGALVALALVHAFGIISMYGLAYRNGYFNALIRLRDQGPHFLPGSDVPILTRFTGIGPLDKVLTLAGVMFANITDGTTPQLSLYAFQFAGQLVPVFTVILIEGNREGNRGNVMSLSVLWGCAMQGLGYGFAMPLYAICHLLISPTATPASPVLAHTVRMRDVLFVRTLVPSIILGYILPSILMAIPTFSPIIHQWLGGFWQGFPVWIILLQYAWKFRSLRFGPMTRENDIDEKKTLHSAYIFAFGVSAATHLTTFGTLGARQTFPSLFSPALNFRDVFLPPMFYSSAQMTNMAIGIQNFFQYDQYVGSTAALVWAVTLHYNSQKDKMTWRKWMWLLGEILGATMIAGPGGALVSLMWHRDQQVISDDLLFTQKDR